MRERFLLQSEVQLVLFWSDYQERSSIKPASTCNPFRNYSKTRSNIHFTFFRNWISNLSFIQFIQSIAWPGDAKCGRENEKLSIVQQSNILSRLFSWTGSCFVRLFVSIRKCFDKGSRCKTERKGCGKVNTTTENRELSKLNCVITSLYSALELKHYLQNKWRIIILCDHHYVCVCLTSTICL